jgi:hypothetical protein
MISKNIQISTDFDRFGLREEETGEQINETATILHDTGALALWSFRGKCKSVVVQY